MKEEKPIISHEALMKAKEALESSGDGPLYVVVPPSLIEDIRKEYPSWESVCDDPLVLRVLP